MAIEQEGCGEGLGGVEKRVAQGEGGRRWGGEGER